MFKEDMKKMFCPIANATCMGSNCMFTENNKKCEPDSWHCIIVEKFKK
jgi:hypothetical protein